MRYDHLNHTAMASAVVMEGVTRTFGKTAALADIHLRIPEGSVFGLLGLNGAGKTTLLKLLMGHLRPDKGTITVLSRDLRMGLMALRERVGYVSEARYLYDWMTVEEMLWFTKGLQSRWDDGRASALVKRFELPLDRKVKHLSAGNRARLCLTLMLSYRPELLLLDEPTAGLDPQVRREFLEHLIDEIAEAGTTVVFSTHLVHEIERVADMVGILHKGHLLVTAPTEDLMSSVRRIHCPYGDGVADLSDLPGMIWHQRLRDEQILIVSNYSELTRVDLEDRGVWDPHVVSLSLEDVFLELVRAVGDEGKDEG
jgi:ABC-2 type transport system ATP-binding protein